MARWHDVMAADPRAASGMAASLPQGPSVLQPHLTPCAQAGQPSLWLSFQNQSENWVYISSMEGGHHIKDPWAVGWRQEGRKGNRRGPEAVHRQEMICTKCWGADELSRPKGQSWGSLAPELRFRGVRRRSRGSQGLGRQTQAWKSSTLCFNAAASRCDQG